MLHACRQDRSFNLQFLKEEFDIGPEQIEALYQFAKFQFDCGNYSMASELLQVRRPVWFGGRGWSCRKGSGGGGSAAAGAAAAVASALRCIGR
jgi:hypothetical protein